MNQQRTTFQHSLALLAHPVSLGAVALLLANDLLFRRLWPSWLTGKLGDAAWLVFTPFFLAALLAWMVPARSGRSRRTHQQVTFSLAFAIIGLGFALVKALPGPHLLATRIFSTLLGAAPSIVLDPTDLLTLPFLALPIWLWWRSTRGSMAKAPVPNVAARGTSAAILRWLALPLAALVLLADAAAPDTGFTCLEARDGKIYADSGYRSYVSSDGGMSWVYDEAGGSGLNCEKQTVTTAGWEQISGAAPGMLYRFRPAEEIQVSTNNGETWQTGTRLDAVTEAQRAYILKSGSGNPVYEPGPLDAALDPASGNMIFAMGQEGVLVHTPAGEWVWSQGGPYRSLGAFPDAEAFNVLLGGSVYMAIGLALLTFATLALRWTKHLVRILLVIGAWIGWLAIHLIFPPATTTSYALAITSMGMLAVALLLVPLVIEQSVRLARRAPRQISLLLVLGLGAGVLYLVPLLLWLYNSLPAFDVANLLALLPAALSVALGFFLVRQRA